MKHIFIINPAAGQGDMQESLCKNITTISDNLGITYEIYRTKAIGDASRFVYERCKSGEDIRFYACGGDGTLSEVINGAVLFDNAQVGMIPIGTGNDFPRSFANNEFFSDIVRQIEGKEKRIDLIKCHNKSTNKIKYGVNMLNIGFDCDVVSQTEKLKHYPMIKGSFAYYVGVVSTLLKPIGKSMRIIFDDKEELEGEFLLAAIANGRCYGGGFKAAPKASVSDGMIDVVIVKKVSRLKFLSLIGKYKEGTYLNSESAKDVILYKRCKSLEIKPLCDLSISIDGEVSNVGVVDFSVVPRALNFSLPKEVYELENVRMSELEQERHTAVQGV